MSEPIWHGQAGHFIGWRNCLWHMCTEVNGYVISSIGEYFPNRFHDKIGEMERLGAGPNDWYETLVYKAGNHCECCGQPTYSYDECEMDRYKTPLEARLGHMALVEKYSKMEPPKPYKEDKQMLLD